MKFQAQPHAVPSILSYGPSWLMFGHAGGASEKIERSVVIGSHGERWDWNCAYFSQLSTTHFEQLAQTQPELIIFGSGKQLRFVSPSLLAGLMRKRIGLETMDTLAACRTYNVLADEGRHVIAALLLETDEPNEALG